MSPWVDQDGEEMNFAKANGFKECKGHVPESMGISRYYSSLGFFIFFGTDEQSGIAFKGQVMWLI